MAISTNHKGTMNKDSVSRLAWSELLRGGNASGNSHSNLSDWPPIVPYSNAGHKCQPKPQTCGLQSKRQHLKRPTQNPTAVVPGGISKCVRPGPRWRVEDVEPSCTSKRTSTQSFSPLAHFIAGCIATYGNPQVQQSCSLPSRCR